MIFIKNSKGFCVEIWAALWTAVVLYIAVKLYRKMKAQPMNDSIL